MLRQLKIGQKLMLGMSVIILFIIVIAFSTYNGISDISKNIIISDYFNEIIKLTKEIRIIEKNFIIRSAPEYVAEMDKIHNKFVDINNKVALLIETDEQQKLLNEISSNRDKYKELFDSYIISHNNFLNSRQELINIAETMESEISLLKKEQTKALKKVSNHRISMADNINDIFNNIGKISISEKNFLLKHDTKYKDEISEIISETKSQILALKSNINSNIGQEKLDKILKILQNYSTVINNNSELYNDCKSKEDGMVLSARLMIKSAEKAGELVHQKMMDSENSTKTISLLFSLIGLLIAMIIAFVINRSIKKGINGIVEQVKEIVKNVVSGKLDTRGDVENAEIDFKGIIEETNDLINTFISPINVMAEYVDRISKGDIPPKITDNYKGDFIEVKNNLNNCIDIMNSLIKETDTLTNGVEKGNLDVRGDSSKFMGSWGTLMKGVNKLTEIFIAPINTMAEYVEKISKGEVPTKIKEEYQGDFKEIKENLNGAVDALEGLVESKKVLGKMALNDFSDEVKGSYLGVYDDIKVSVNQVTATLRRVQNIVVNISNGDICDLENLKKIGKRSEKDNLIPSFILMLESLTALIKGSQEYVYYCSKGELEKIALDERGIKGVYKEIFEGLNKAATITVTPLLETLTVLQEMEKGDFAIEIKGNYEGGFLMLKNAVNNSIASVSQLLGEVKKTIEQVSNGSQQVSSASQILSQGATEQASSIEEISSSMHEIANQTSKNAENAVEANKLTVETTKVAEQGSNEMDNLLNAMSEIQKSSSDISKIIKVIDEIAFQTNLLALNAAVEAARAGAHGKGFAVVAEEVRNLAARSAKAAKETGEMIENAVQKSNAGAEMSKETAAILNEIVSNVSRVSNIVGEIATASNEQAHGVSQINAGLSQVEQVTQSNTASAEESAAASEELSSQAVHLESMIKKFVLKEIDQNLITSSNVRISNSRSMISNKTSMRLQTPEEIISLDNRDFGRY